MKKEINDILLQMQNGQLDVGEAANELLNLFSVSSRREQLIAFFDKANDNDIQECVNGFAGRVFDRLEGN